MSDKDKDEDTIEDAVAFRRKRYGRRLGDQDKIANIWMISFTDVMALMLTFFVLLFAMSNPKEEDWDNLKDSVQSNFNRFHGLALNRGFQDTININKVNYSQALDLNYLKAIILALIEEEPSLEVVSVITQPRSLIISLPQDLLFDSGRADVKDGARDALFTLAGSLSRIKNRIEIIGHADPRPVTGGDFPSNWELSLARASQVAGVLENVGYDQNVTIRGYASGRYQDLPEKLGEQKRLDLSRRVDIVIMEDDGKRVKLFDIGMP